MNPNPTTPQSWRDLPDKSAPLPSTQVAVLIKNVSFNPARSGKPMLTLTLEIVAPATTIVAGNNVAVAGRELKHWLAFGDNKGAYADAETMAAPYLPGNSLDVPVGDPGIPKLVGELIVGKAMSGVFVESEAEYEKDGSGNNIIDPTTGQSKVKRWNLRLKSVTTAVPLSTLGL